MKSALTYKALADSRIPDLSRDLGGPGVRGLVSVVVPTFNRRELLLVAIASALGQTYSDIEVVVIDDGSSDGTAEALSGADPRVRYGWQENAGVQAARNSALRRCRGEFIAFLDSDDAWLPWKLEVQVRLLREFPELGMVWTDMMTIDSSGEVIDERYLRRMYAAHSRVRIEDVLRRYGPLAVVWPTRPNDVDGFFYHGDVFPHMILGNLVHTPTVLVRRTTVSSAGGFDESLRVAGGDYEFHFRIMSYGPAGLLDTPSTLYRVGAADARTASRNMAHIARNNLTTLRRYLDASAERQALPLFRRRTLMATAYAWVGEAELFAERSREAARALWSSICQQPFRARTWRLLVATLAPAGLLEWLRAVKRGQETHRFL